LITALAVYLSAGFKSFWQFFINSKHEKAEWENAESLLDTERGSGEFGHTGKN